jgi:hypothetical protein
MKFWSFELRLDPQVYLSLEGVSNVMTAE